MAVSMISRRTFCRFFAKIPFMKYWYEVTNNKYVETKSTWGSLLKLIAERLNNTIRIINSSPVQFHATCSAKKITNSWTTLIRGRYTWSGKGRHCHLFVCIKITMAGFKCEFVEPPAKYLKMEHSIYLCILRDPYQATCCCSKNFAKLVLKRWRIAKVLVRVANLCSLTILRQVAKTDSLQLPSPLYTQEQGLWVDRRTEGTRQSPQQEPTTRDSSIVP